jgi:hypothetical protein
MPKIVHCSAGSSCSAAYIHAQVRDQRSPSLRRILFQCASTVEYLRLLASNYLNCGGTQINQLCSAVSQLSVRRDSRGMLSIQWRVQQPIRSGHHVNNEGMVAIPCDPDRVYSSLAAGPPFLTWRRCSRGGRRWQIHGGSSMYLFIRHSPASPEDREAECPRPLGSRDQRAHVKSWASANRRRPGEGNVGRNEDGRAELAQLRRRTSSRL